MILHHTSAFVCPLCEEKLKSVHPYIYSWFYLTKFFVLNLHTSCTYRNKEDQNRLFKEGKTELQYPLSEHNKMPARAIDLFLLTHSGKAIWDVGFFTSLNECNLKNNRNLRWGGHFKKLRDYSHFEMRKPWLRRLYEFFRRTFRLS